MALRLADAVLRAFAWQPWGRDPGAPAFPSLGAAAGPRRFGWARVRPVRPLPGGPRGLWKEVVKS